MKQIPAVVADLQGTTIRWAKSRICGLCGSSVKEGSIEPLSKSCEQLFSFIHNLTTQKCGLQRNAQVLDSKAAIKSGYILSSKGGVHWKRVAWKTGRV